MLGDKFADDPVEGVRHLETPLPYDVVRSFVEYDSVSSEDVSDRYRVF
jgi:hypothetical protein